MKSSNLSASFRRHAASRRSRVASVNSSRVAFDHEIGLRAVAAFHERGDELAQGQPRRHATFGRSKNRRRTLRRQERQVESARPCRHWQVARRGRGDIERRGAQEQNRALDHRDAARALPSAFAVEGAAAFFGRLQRLRFSTGAAPSAFVFCGGTGTPRSESAWYNGRHEMTLPADEELDQRMRCVHGNAVRQRYESAFVGQEPDQSRAAE